MSEFSGDIEDGLIAVVQNARCPPAYFARLLYKAMKGLGTNEGVLNRVIVARCEVISFLLEVMRLIAFVSCGC